MTSVRVGNELAVRTTALCLLGWTTGIGYTIEQPVSSLLKDFPCVRALFQHTKAATVPTYMGAFGGCTPKPLLLYGTSTWIKKLRRKRPSRSSSTSSLVKKKGKQVTGVKLALKCSQAYTASFGEAAGHAKHEARSK